MLLIFLGLPFALIGSRTFAYYIERGWLRWLSLVFWGLIPFSLPFGVALSNGCFRWFDKSHCSDAEAMAMMFGYFLMPGWLLGMIIGTLSGASRRWRERPNA